MGEGSGGTYNIFLISFYILFLQNNEALEKSQEYKK